MSSAAWFDPSLCGIVVVGIASLYYLSNKRKATEFDDSEFVRKRAERDDSPTSTSKYTVGTPHPYSSEPKFKGCIYLDYNATTPVFPEVTEAMMPYLTYCFGNPSSSHIFSIPCREALQTARKHVGALVNARDPLMEICFTSCGTESDNRAVDIALHHFAQYKKKWRSERGLEATSTLPHVITCKTEHPAVICYLRILVLEQRIRMTVLQVDGEGFINVADLRKALTPDTALVTLMHSNNEVGTIHPIREVAQCIRQYNQQMQGEACVLLHSDAAQSLGKVLVDVQALDVDMLTIVGHKYGAPKGVAALYMRKGIDAPPMLVGGGQERGLRSGTENVALAVGLGEASRLALQESGALVVHLLTLKQRLISALVQGFADRAADVRFNGPKRANNPKDLLADLKVIRVMIKSDSSGSAGAGTGAGAGAGASAGVSGAASGTASPHTTAVKSAMTVEVLQQLPNTVSVSFRGIMSYEIIDALSEKVACSAGSACHAVHIESDAQGHTTAPAVKMSDVLAAMGVPEEFGFGTLRLSLGRHSTEQDVDVAAAHIVAAIKAAWARK